MIIQLPPEIERQYVEMDEIRIPNPYFTVKRCIEDILEIENHYKDRFKWFAKEHFKGALPMKIDSILNYGCSHSEAFALHWSLCPSQTIGIDKDQEKIKLDNRRVDLIRALINRNLPQLLNELEGRTDNEHAEYQKSKGYREGEIERIVKYYEGIQDKFITWYDQDIPSSIKELRLPEFRTANIANRDELRIPDVSNQYDVIYGRCVLYLAEMDGNDISRISRNLSDLLKPASGRLIFVEPFFYKKLKENLTAEFDIRQVFIDAGLEPWGEEVTDEEKLDGNEIHSKKGFDAKLSGSVFYKP